MNKVLGKILSFLKISFYFINDSSFMYLYIVILFFPQIINSHSSIKTSQVLLYMWEIWGLCSPVFFTTLHQIWDHPPQLSGLFEVLVMNPAMLANHFSTLFPLNKVDQFVCKVDKTQKKKKKNLKKIKHHIWTENSIPSKIHKFKNKMAVYI